MKNFLDLSEKQIENSILSFLTMKGIFCWKHENNAVYDPKIGKHRKSRSAFKPNGISDIIGIMPCGRMIALEVKVPKRRNTATKDQKEFIRNIIKHNGISAVVTSIDEVLNVLRESEREKNDNSKNRRT